MSKTLLKKKQEIKKTVRTGDKQLDKFIYHIEGKKIRNASGI